MLTGPRFLRTEGKASTTSTATGSSSRKVLGLIPDVLSVPVGILPYSFATYLNSLHLTLDGSRNGMNK